MTDIPDHIVERVAIAIDKASFYGIDRDEADILARATIEALGGEEVRARVNQYSYGTVYPDRAEDTPIKSFTDRYLLIPLVEEGEQ